MEVEKECSFHFQCSRGLNVLFGAQKHQTNPSDILLFFLSPEGKKKLKLRQV